MDEKTAKDLQKYEAYLEELRKENERLSASVFWKPNWGKPSGHFSSAGHASDAASYTVAADKLDFKSFSATIAFAEEVLPKAPPPPEPKKPTVPKPEAIVSALDGFVIGHEATKKALAIAAYFHYFRIEKSASTFRKSNICLIGPTGTGKTLLLSSLAEVLNVPFVTVDCTELTPDGYVGTDVGGFIDDIKAKKDQKAEHAIIFLDEADKIASGSSVVGGGGLLSGANGMRGGSSHKTTDVQKALLKVVEGKMAGAATGLGGSKRMDTTKMLFVMGGAFSGITSDPRYGREGTSITTEDLVRYGLMPEFVGRFPTITTLDPLTEEALVSILMQPKHGVIEEYQTIFREHGQELLFEPDALKALAAVAAERKTGARALRGVVEKVLFEDLYRLPSQEGGEGRVVITEALVRQKLGVKAREKVLIGCRTNAVARRHGLAVN